MFKIEKGVPVPEQVKRPPYPFKEMEIGDSFTVDKKYEASVRNAASSAGRISGKRFSARRMDNGCIRIWRIA